jgi:hypothetical protein
MPTQRVTTRSEVEDLIRGLAFMGTGGGGRPDAGREFLLSHIDKGESVGWTDVAELADDGWACCVFSMGTTAPRPADFKPREYPEYGRNRAPGSALTRAIRELETYTGKRVSVVFPLEIGASNTCGPMHVAAALGLQFADGDGSGRAVPEAPQSTPALTGQSMWPSSICDDWGNVMILKQAVSLDLAEAIGKGMSMISKVPDPYVFLAMSAYLMPVATLRKVIIPGTVSRAYELGKTIRQARERGQDPVIAAAEFMNGRILFKGTVTKREWQSTGGYQIGTTDITGTGDDAGHTFRIWFKNEHHITWKDGAPFVTSPDMIAVVHADTAEPITNTYLAEGMKVAVVGNAADARMRTPEAVAVLGPKHFGFEIPYRPFEQVVR